MFRQRYDLHLQRHLSLQGARKVSDKKLFWWQTKQLQRANSDEKEKSLTNIQGCELSNNNQQLNNYMSTAQVNR